RVEQVPGESEKTVDKLTFIDRDAFNSLAYFLFEAIDGVENRPWIVGFEFERFHCDVAVWIPALNDAGAAFCVVAGFENEDILLCVLTAHLCAPQELGGLVAS